MSKRRLQRRILVPLAGLLLTAGLGAAAPALPSPGPGGGSPEVGAATDPSGVCRAAPEVVRLQPTQSAPGALGRMILTPAESAYGIAVDAEGRQRFDIRLEIERLRRRDGATYVAWAATPELDRVARLGILDSERRIDGRVAWNKFLVFVSEERAPDGERWAGPILLTGLSPSGRMHTMAGHGPFEGIACQDFY